jgi:phosphate transport system substrate-binding protein
MVFHSLLRVIALVAIGSMLVTAASGKTLKVGGTGAVIELVNQLAPVFREETGITLHAIRGLGSSGSYSAVADGKIDLAFGGRDLKDKEAARGLKVAMTFRSPFGLVTSHPAPGGLESAAISALYKADKPAWPDGTRILIILRPADDSDNSILATLAPGMADTLAQLRNRSDLPIATTDHDNADLAERINGSLTAATLTQITVEKRDLRFVPIDGVAATIENYRRGAYPHGKTFHVALPSTASPEARAFVAFLKGPAGEAPLHRAAIVTGK